MATASANMIGSSYFTAGNSSGERLTVVTFENPAGADISIDSIKLYLGTGSGDFTSDDDVYGSGAPILTNVKAYSIISSAVNVDNVIDPTGPEGGTYPNYNSPNWELYTFTFSNLVVAANNTVNFDILRPELGKCLVVSKSEFGPKRKATISYTVVNQNVTLSYNANGGGGAPASQILTSGVAGTISSTRPSRVNYEFLGWSTSPNATTATYQPGGSITITSNTTLYAVWLEKVTITFNSNGGDTTPASQTVPKNTVINLPPIGSVGHLKVRLQFDSNGGNPVPDMYVDETPLGWSTKGYGTDIDYNFGQSYTATSNTTLYCTWKNKIMTPNEWPTPTYTNATFQGWWSDAHGGDQLNNKNYEVLWPLTAYAKWNYKITYNFNGGSIDYNSYTGEIGSASPNKFDEKLYDTPYTIKSWFPVKLNQEFDGWRINGNTSTKYQPSQTYNISNAPATFTAAFNQKYYSVTFTDGYTGSVISELQIAAGNSVSSTQFPNPPTRPGYKFIGWLGDTTNIQSNTIISAMWELGIIWIYRKNKGGWIPYKPKEG